MQNSTTSTKSYRIRAHETETRCFHKIVDAEIAFFKDANGAVPHLILYQGAQVIKGSRKP